MIKALARNFANRVSVNFAERQAAVKLRGELQGRFVSPFGDCLHKNTTVKEEEIIGYHGGNYPDWQEQAQRVDGYAREGGLFVGPLDVAAQYSQMHEEPVILQVAAQEVPHTDHDTGCGNHLSIPQGTPFKIHSVHEVNPEYIEHQAKVSSVAVPTIVSCLSNAAKEALRETSVVTRSPER